MSLFQHFEQKSYIPYKHVLLVFILITTTIFYWWYVPSAPTSPENSDRANNTIATSIPIKLSPITQDGVTAGAIVNKKDHSQDKQLIANLIEKRASSESTAEAEVAVTATKEHENIENKVVIQQGDTLSMLFDRYQLGQTTLRAILSADEPLLALETLRPGQILYFRYQKNYSSLDDTSELQEMELYKHSAHRIIYRRDADGAFNYETFIEAGQWRNERISGTIDGAFYLSAQRAGLNEKETANVTRIFQEQLNFARSIRKGDQFQIIRSVQIFNGQPTGQTQIKSARIQRRAYEHTAFLFEDGRYYDENGKSLARAFRRIPLKKRYRISSRFNPRRVHPVTGRVGPHNGTDFATPTGTKVLSTGDGVVARVGNHPYAGRYIDIQHGGAYKTRYLHLHRILVRRGESVSRGQTIALTGNTGRSTGPHLHFELHIHGRPVDPMKAKIPIARSINKKDRQAFAKLVKEQSQLLDASNKKASAVNK